MLVLRCHVSNSTGSRIRLANYRYVSISPNIRCSPTSAHIGGRGSIPASRSQIFARMLACDCTRVDVEASESGEILDVGRARRTIPSAIGRALWLRDGGCRLPGCGRKYHLHGHPIEAWADGGKTSASNLVLLCPTHHTLVHEGQLQVEVHEGRIEFRNAYGLKLHPTPDRGADLEELDHWLRTADPGFHRDFPLWDGSPLDLEFALNSML
jgi:hypothetical protein